MAPGVASSPGAAEPTTAASGGRRSGLDLVCYDAERGPARPADRLALTRQIVERLGGTIAVSSKVGEGSLFLVKLPESAKESGERAA